MRYLIDTNIIVYIISDPDSLDNDVKAIISDPDNTLYTSSESAKELVIAYRNKGLLTKRWGKAEDMLNSIEDGDNCGNYRYRRVTERGSDITPEGTPL